MEPTKFGVSPTSTSETDKAYICPLGPSGHVNGLNVMSEVWLDGATWNGSDINLSTNYIGAEMGLFASHQLLIVSQKAFQLLRKFCKANFSYRAVHLVEP